MYFLLHRSLSTFFQLINLLIVIRVLLSWVRYNPYSKYIILLFQLTDPILDPFKKLSNRLNLANGMLDVSPLLAYFTIQFLIQPLAFTILRLFFRS